MRAIGQRTLHLVAVLFRFDTRAEIGGPPAVPGQHSREVLQQFGYSDARIDQLCAASVLFESAAPIATSTV